MKISVSETPFFPREVFHLARFSLAMVWTFSTSDFGIDLKET